MSEENYQDVQGAPSQPERPREPRPYDEKDEKEMRKHDEKHEEKDYEEKWRRDPLGAVVWACILIWAGLAFLVNNLGYWDRLTERLPGMAGLGAWSLVFLGAGLILVAEVVVRLLVPAYRRPVLGTIIIALVLFGIALGDLISWNIIWPLILIVIGVSILLGGFRRHL